MPTNSQDSPTITGYIKVLAASANALVNKGELDDAENIYSKILAIAPYHATSLSFFASRAANDGDINKALIFLDKAIRGNPHNPLLFQNRALLYKSLGQHDAALSDLNIAIGLKPGMYQAMLHKAYLLKERGDWNGATKIITGVWKQLKKIDSEKQHTIDEPTRALLTEAGNIVRAAQLIVVDAELEPLIAEFGRESMQRVFESVAAFMGLRAKRLDESPASFDSLFIEGLKQPHFFEEERYIRVIKPRKRVVRLRNEIAGLLKSGGTIQKSDKSSVDRHISESEIIRYSLDRNLLERAATPELASLLRNPVFTSEAGDRDPAMLSLVPPGKHLLRSKSGENWTVASYIALNESDFANLHVENITQQIPVDECIVVSNAYDHYINVESTDACPLLSLRAWHPELSAAEVKGIVGVLRAFKRFQENYVWNATY